VAKFTAVREAGRCAEAAGLADALLRDVRETGYAPLLAEALFTTGMLGDSCGDAAAGVPRLREAFDAALAGRDDELALNAACVMSTILPDRLGQVASGREWLGTARALLDRMGGHKRLEIWWANSEGTVLRFEGRLAEGVAAHKRAYVAAGRLVPPDEFGRMLQASSYGAALQDAGRSSEALAVDQEVLRWIEQNLGPEHPQLAVVLINETEALNGLGRHADARQAALRALAVSREVGASLARYAQLALGVSFLSEGRPEEAIEPLEKAVKSITPDDHARLGQARFALARALWSRPAARPRALSLARLARADFQALTNAFAAKPLAAIDAWLAAPSSKL
jgi:tetratricopeptide (TPR) repeat protein